MSKTQKTNAMAEVYRIIMELYQNVKLGRTQFMESWEFSIKGKGIFRTKYVIVRLSKTALLREKEGNNKKVIALDACVGDDMGIYLAELTTSYDTEKNSGRMFLKSNDIDIDGLMVEGMALCSKEYLAKVWRLKKLKTKYGDMTEFLMAT